MGLLEIVAMYVLQKDLLFRRKVNQRNLLTLWIVK